MEAVRRRDKGLHLGWVSRGTLQVRQCLAVTASNTDTEAKPLPPLDGDDDGDEEEEEEAPKSLEVTVAYSPVESKVTERHRG
jgi:hypothetical protein